MKKLTIEHLAAYLPYELPIQYEYLADKNKYTGLLIAKGFENVGKEHDLIIFDGQTISIDYCKPILHNLSDLTKEIELNGEKFVPIERISKNTGIDEENLLLWIQGVHAIFMTMENSIKINKMLHQYHFAINIPKNLYIDINKL